MRKWQRMLSVVWKLRKERYVANTMANGTVSVQKSAGRNLKNLLISMPEVIQTAVADNRNRKSKVVRKIKVYIFV